MSLSHVEADNLNSLNNITSHALPISPPYHLHTLMQSIMRLLLNTYQSCRSSIDEFITCKLRGNVKCHTKIPFLCQGLCLCGYRRVRLTLVGHAGVQAVKQYGEPRTLCLRCRYELRSVFGVEERAGVVTVVVWTCG